MIYRFTIRITVGPTDRPLLDVFRWVIGLVTDAHAMARFPVKVSVTPERRSLDDG